MKVLLLVDIQNDFLPDGALPVPGGDAIVPVVNQLMPRFDLVVATQDWHPQNHGSFAANHPGRIPMDVVDLHGLRQTLWPVHCVQNTPGACLGRGLNTSRIARIFPKGTDPKLDSYSGFFDNGHQNSTGLAEWLKTLEVDALWVAGLATDYCVKFTVLDALTAGFRVKVITDACRGIDSSPGNVQAALDEMRHAGADLINYQNCP